MVHVSVQLVWLALTVTTIFASYTKSDGLYAIMIASYFYLIDVLYLSGPICLLSMRYRTAVIVVVGSRIVQLRSTQGLREDVHLQ